MDMAFTVAEYMERFCMCGAPRRAHAHANNGRLAPEFKVVGVANGCEQFVDAIERELGGNPLTNKHLAPLMQQGD